MSSADAAWVQAIGSVLAIFVAIFVAWWQSKVSRDFMREQREHESADLREIRKTRLRSIASVAERAAQTVMTTCGAVSGVSLDPVATAKIRRRVMETALEWISSIPLGNEPGILVSPDIFSIKLKIAQLLDVLDGIIECNEVSDERRQKLDSIYRAMKGMAQQIGEYADEYDGGYTVYRVVDLD